jgi:hypothetical protein
MQKSTTLQPFFQQHRRPIIRHNLTTLMHPNASTYLFTFLEPYYAQIIPVHGMDAVHLHADDLL